jgi:hypothetical protein
MFISVSLKRECSFRFAEPIVSHASSMTRALRVRRSDRAGAGAGVERRGKDTAVVGVGFEELAEDAASVVGAAVGLCGQDDEKAEIRCGRVSDLVGEDRRDLG